MGEGGEVLAHGKRLGGATWLTAGLKNSYKIYAFLGFNAFGLFKKFILCGGNDFLRNRFLLRHRRFIPNVVLS